MICRIGGAFDIAFRKNDDHLTPVVPFDFIMVHLIAALEFTFIIIIKISFNDLRRQLPLLLPQLSNGCQVFAVCVERESQRL